MVQCIYVCNACPDLPCTLVATTYGRFYDRCPVNGPYPEAKWARLVPVESAQTGLQQLKQAIADVRKNVSIIEQQACV